jgi:polyisoprenoid-binding protein YceI
MTQTVTYTIDAAHSSAGFKVRHMMISNVHGEFSRLSGTVHFNPADPAASSVEVTIPVASLTTRDEQRDAHLKSADFFDAEKYPEIQFRSRQVTPNGDGEWKVTGDLTVHGVTKQVTLDVEGPTPEATDPWGGVRSGVAVTAKINRKDFGLVWNVGLETGGVLVGEEVHIQIEAELIRQAVVQNAA